MFERPEITYQQDPRLLDLVLKDEGNPLRRIAEIIPGNAKVLDIGAGNGLLAQVLKQTRKQVTIDGIEISRHAAELATPYYRKFHVGPFQSIKSQIVMEDYDYIVLADVIEHVENPLQFLQELTSGLSEKTKIAFSIPHVAHGSVRLGLLNGEFDYTDSGLLERTHLRFFTLRTIKALFEVLRYNIEKLYYLENDTFARGAFTRRFHPGFLSLYRMLGDTLALTRGFVIVVTKKECPLEEKRFHGGKRTGLWKNFILAFIPANLLDKIKNRVRRQS